MNTMILAPQNTGRHRAYIPSVRVFQSVEERVAGRFDIFQLILWLIIGWIGALDTYLTVKFRNVMPYVEENPVGLWLMRLDNQDVSLFVGLKVAGIIAVLGFLAWLCTHARRGFAYAVIIPIAMFQLTLLYYLFS